MPNRPDAAALERILDVTRDLARPLELETMLEHVIEAARTVLDAERGTVFLFDTATDELFSKVATGEREIRVPVSKGIVGECARTRRVINVPDCYADPRFNREIDRQTGYRTRCMLAVPLIGPDDSLEGVLQVLNKRDSVFGEDDKPVARALAAQSAVALQRVRLLRDMVARQRMERELEVARDIQQRVFPRSMPLIDGYELAGWARPADQTGGDIYDVLVQADGGVILLLGDATGHGIGPALSVTQMRAMLRMCTRFGVGLDDTVQQINDQLSEDLAANRFVTAFLGRLDPGKHELVYHAAGQGPLLHYHRATDEAEWITSSTRPLGMLGDLPLGASRRLTLAPGDLLLLSTDGIYEYADAAGEMFGEEPIASIVREHRGAHPSELIERIVAAVEKFADGEPQQDDLTLLLIRSTPEKEADNPENPA